MGLHPVTKTAARVGMSLVLLTAHVAIVYFALFRTVSTEGAERMNAVPVNEHLRTGVGAQVSFARMGAKPEAALASVESAAAFIHLRSGIHLRPETIHRLATLESQILAGTRPRISIDGLSSAMCMTLLEDLRACTDEDIERAADIFARNITMKSESGAIVPDANLVALPYGQMTIMTRERFTARVRDLRTHAGMAKLAGPLFMELQGEMREYVERRIGRLTQALPDQWSDATTTGLTPSQALIIAYAVVSADPLDHSPDELRAKTVLGDTLASRNAPSLTPFGSAGGLHSTPTDMLLDGNRLDRLFIRIEERGAR